VYCPILKVEELKLSIMEYPKRPKPIFKRPRKVPFPYRHPKIFYFGTISVSMLLLFSRVIYDLIYRPSTIDPLSLTPEERKAVVARSQRLMPKQVYKN